MKLNSFSISTPAFCIWHIVLRNMLVTYKLIYKFIITQSEGQVKNWRRILKSKRLARTKIISVILVILMKSCFAGWNPSKLGWNLRCAASDETKSAFFNLAKQDFITKWFHPRSGLIPTKADLVKKRLQFCIKITTFFCAGRNIRQKRNKTWFAIANIKDWSAP